MNDYWHIDMSSSFISDSFKERREIVNNLKLDWLDIEKCYYSSEAMFFTDEDILKRSDWTEKEVRLLFLDRRFPSTEYARKKIVEVHSLIYFFMRIADEKREQELISGCK